MSANKSEIIIKIIRLFLPNICNFLTKNITILNAMDEENLLKAFEQLRKSGYTTVDHLIEWMKTAKIIEITQIPESRIRQMFGVDKNVQVNFEQFQNVVERMAAENQKLVEDVTQMLVSKTPKLMEALEAAARAYEEGRMKEKK